MRDIEDFVKTSVKIELIEEPDKYGYFPYHMFVEDEEGKINIICIVGIESVGDCYQIWFKYLNERAKRIYMAIDFPARFDDKHDFVAVYSYNRNDSFDMFAIPYNNKTGEVYERTKRTKSLQIIANEFYRTALCYAKSNFQNN